MCVVLNDEIVDVIEPQDEPLEYRLDDVSGTLRLIIAGESANFSFRIPMNYYNEFVPEFTD